MPTAVARAAYAEGVIPRHWKLHEGTRQLIASASLATITLAGNLIAQRLQALANRRQLVLDSVNLDPVLTLLRDLPQGLQRLVEAGDGLVDATQRVLSWSHEVTPFAA